MFKNCGMPNTAHKYYSNRSVFCSEMNAIWLEIDMYLSDQWIVNKYTVAENEGSMCSCDNSKQIGARMTATL